MRRKGPLPAARTRAAAFALLLAWTAAAGGAGAFGDITPVERLAPGDADLAQLYGYVLPKVSDAARLDNRDQTPQAFPKDPKRLKRFKLR